MDSNYNVELQYRINELLHILEEETIGMPQEAKLAYAVVYAIDRVSQRLQQVNPIAGMAAQVDPESNAYTMGLLTGLYLSVAHHDVARALFIDMQKSQLFVAAATIGDIVQGVYDSFQVPS